MSTKSIILNAEQIEQKINRIAYQIAENNIGEKEIIIAGIANSGYLFAQKVSKVLKKISELKITLGKIEIDKKNPLSKDIHFSLQESDYKNKVVIIFDDVLNSGKILAYTSKFFLNSPLKKLACAVLVNRDHPSYPVSAEYVGLSLSTTLKDLVHVEFKEKGKSVVYLT
ncbi:MAG: phosphoribosyltransferase [Bacteroidetes bacterium]|nr:phosphoribosyltransferase [Bacteroidota bacterium]MBV6461576.1 Bifunctional protein pyrR [Flavobacteriales bacterium]WKZ74056.1 MAG: phosphoribosyltransferase family protein [Vicingaceae bacterium]MCL4817190.1 phosphoribosyltransferase [Flavobacteriales bacterium]NOG95855.1 phosphoribosyltransferase [Bacteroidota bacterium]